ncbi:MAG: hypothetical protein KatS3mg061_3127 [Dehalococcoidia bacterium]|nr:MAG: hypothetical protein KatS3mg061_3127 [Dehalococcoidia bacterium]
MARLAGPPRVTALLQANVHPAVQERRWIVGASAALLLAMALRLNGLSGLVLFGDGAASIFFASQDWPVLAAATAADSHPPLYYVLVRLSAELFGWNELAVRLPSLVPGVLLVALLVSAGRQLGGAFAGIALGLLAALHPALVLASRQPRMYALLALLSLALLWLAGQPKGGQRRAVALVLLSLAALLTHYLAVLPVAGAALLRLRAATGGGKRLLALWPFALAGALWLPWLAYAWRETLRHTTQTIAGVPPPPTVLHWLGSLGVSLAMGTWLPLKPSLLLALAAGLVVLTLLASVRRWPSWPAEAALLLTAGAVGIYVVQPLFARPRFFIPLVPLALLLLARPLGACRGARALAPVGVLALLLAVGLAASLPVERGTFELEAVRLGEELTLAQEADVVVLQPWWQAGYLRLHLARPPELVDLRALDPAQWPRLLDRQRDIWLVLLGVGRRDPTYPLEGWLDQHAYRVDERTIGALRLVRYTVAPDPSLLAPLALPNGLSLALAPARTELLAGAALPVLVRWQATQALEERLVLFLHLDRPDGVGIAGRDEEPESGWRQDGRWRAGETVNDRRGLVVPVWTPPGDYQLVAGLYRREDGTPVATSTGRSVVVGQVRVLPRPARGSSRAVGSGAAALEEVWTAWPDPGAALRHRVETVDGPQTLSEPIAGRPGQPLIVALGWRQRRPTTPLTAVLQLRDARGGVVADRKNELTWASADTLAVTRHELPLPAPGRYQLTVELRPASSQLPSGSGGDETLSLGWLLVAP